METHDGTTEGTDMAVILRDSYTVVGYYEDTNEAFAQNVEAVTVEEAFDIIARGWGRSGDLIIIGATPVRTELIPPDQDGGKCVYAQDLLLEDQV